MIKKNREWVRSLGLNGTDARRCARALGVLVDLEGAIKTAGSDYSNFAWAHENVCAVLRSIADAWEFPEE